MLLYFVNIQENQFHEKKFGELSACIAITANKLEVAIFTKRIQIREISEI